VLETTLESFEEVIDSQSDRTLFSDTACRQLDDSPGQEKGKALPGSHHQYLFCFGNSGFGTNRGEYCISKAGMSMVTQLFAARLGEYNIPVYEVRPGVMDTDMTAGAKEKYDKLIARGPMCLQKRWGKPEDVGKAVASLVRGDFPYSTGQVIMVDGGLTISRL
jgi:3-oxoacyl-[acyl-carrier protein] reductase